MLASGLCHSDLHAFTGSLKQRFPFVRTRRDGVITAPGEGVRSIVVYDQ